MAKKIEDAIREAEKDAKKARHRYWHATAGSQTEIVAFNDLNDRLHALDSLRAAQARGETTVPEDGE